MALQDWFERSSDQPGAPGLGALTVSSDEWRQVAQDVAAVAGEQGEAGRAGIGPRVVGHQQRGHVEPARLRDCLCPIPAARPPAGWLQL